VDGEAYGEAINVEQMAAAVDPRDKPEDDERGMAPRKKKKMPEASLRHLSIRYSLRALTRPN